MILTQEDLTTLGAWAEQLIARVECCDSPEIRQEGQGINPSE